MSRMNGLFSRFTKQTQAPPKPPGAFGTSTSIIAPRKPTTLKPTPDEDPDFIRIDAENKQLRNRIQYLEAEVSSSKDQLQISMASTEPNLNRLRAEVASLRTEKDALTNRCEELEEKAKIAQSVLEQHDATTKLETEELTKERRKLRVRCEELSEQSQVNQNILHDCASKLRSRDVKIETLQFLNEGLRKETIKSTPALAEIAHLRHNVYVLQTDLRLAQEHNFRLRAWGCTDPCPVEEECVALSRRVETLESQNHKLQNQLAEQKALARREVGELANKCNALTEQLRIAETDVQYSLKASNVSDTLFRTLKAEYDDAVNELHLEHTANKILEMQILSLSSRSSTTPTTTSSHPPTPSSPPTHPPPSPTSSQTQIQLLTTQLAKATAFATERENLLRTFQEQQCLLMRSVKQDREERAELQKTIDAMYAENALHRKRFEDMLREKEREREGYGLGSEGEGEGVGMGG